MTAFVRSPVFPVVVATPALLVLGWMVYPHVTQLGRDARRSRGGRLVAELATEVGEWWRRRRNPGRVAAFTDPHEDEGLWLTTVPPEHLGRKVRPLRRMQAKGRLYGANIRALRVVRSEMRRRLENANRPNRAVMDQLSAAETKRIRQYLNAEETT